MESLLSTVIEACQRATPKGIAGLAVRQMSATLVARVNGSSVTSSPLRCSVAIVWSSDRLAEQAIDDPLRMLPSLLKHEAVRGEVMKLDEQHTETRTGQDSEQRTDRTRIVPHAGEHQADQAGAEQRVGALDAVEHRGVVVGEGDGGGLGIRPLAEADADAEERVAFASASAMVRLKDASFRMQLIIPAAPGAPAPVISMCMESGNAYH